MNTKTKNKILIILLVIAFIALLMLLATAMILTPKRTQELSSHVRVENYVGINLDSDKVYFGTVTPGGQGQRSIELLTDKDYFLLVQISGDNAQWVRTENRALHVQKDHAYTMVFNADIPRNTTYGNYTGDINLIFYHPLARFLLG